MTTTEPKAIRAAKVERMGLPTQLWRIEAALSSDLSSNTGRFGDRWPQDLAEVDYASATPSPAGKRPKLTKVVLRTGLPRG